MGIKKRLHIAVQTLKAQVNFDYLPYKVRSHLFFRSSGLNLSSNSSSFARNSRYNAQIHNGAVINSIIITHARTIEIASS